MCCVFSFLCCVFFFFFSQRWRGSDQAAEDKPEADAAKVDVKVDAKGKGKGAKKADE